MSDAGAPGERLGAVAFADVHHALTLFAQAIAGRALTLEPLQPTEQAERAVGHLDGPVSDGGPLRAAFDGETIRLPQRVVDFASTAHNRGAYRVLVAKPAPSP